MTALSSDGQRGCSREKANLTSPPEYEMVLFPRTKLFRKLFFYFSLTLPLIFSAHARSEDTAATPSILIESHEKPNLVGFIPPEKLTRYTLQPVPSSDAVMQSLLGGRTLLGFVSPLDFLQAASQGIPVVALASPFQYTPVAFAYKKNVFRRSFEDFKGMSVLYEPGSLGEVLFKHFLRRINIAPSEVIWVPLAPGEAKSFKKADIIILDQISETVHFSRNAATDRILYPHDFGIHFKGPLLVTTREALEKKPAEVKTLASAALDIFQLNLFDEKNIYRILLQRIIPYALQPEQKLGLVTERDWWYMERTLLEEGVLESPVAPQDLFSPLLFEAPRERPKGVTLALPGLPSVDFAGFYAAEDNGYYVRTDRSVSLRHLASESEVVESVRQGKSLMGVASPYTILKAHGEIPDLKILGVIYQKDPAFLLSLSEMNGKGKIALTKKVFLIGEGGQGVLLDAIQTTFLKKGDLPVPHGRYPNLFSLLDGKADVVTGRLSFEDPRLERYKDLFQIFIPKNAGGVGLTIFTTRKNYEANRELIKNLLKATFHGFENSIFQTDITAESVMDRDGGLSFKDLKRSLKENSQYIKDSHGIIGSIDPGKWQGLAELAVNKGFIEKMPDLKEFFPDEVKWTGEASQ